MSDFKNTYQYDALQRLIDIVQQGQSGGNAVTAKHVSQSFNALSQRTNIARFQSTGTTSAVATTDFTFDTINRLTGIAHKQGANNLNTYTYAFDPLSRITSVTSTAEGTSSYNYDQSSQVTGATHTSQSNESYGFDANGNRNTSGYTTGSNNQTTAGLGFTFTYDDEGNRLTRTETATGHVQSYDWDYRNRLVSVKERNTSGGAIVKQVNYEYDPMNRLVRREYDADGAGSGAATNQYWIYDEGINAILQFDGSAGSNLSHRYLWSNQVDELLADEQVTSLSTGGNTLWGLGDHLGTLRDIADLNESTGVTSITNHRTYNAFGKLTAETNAAVDMLFGFTGKQLDESTGLQHNLHRWYDSATGQWMSEDPLSFYAGDSNVRRYVGNGAISSIDPSGLQGDELPGRNLLTWRNALLERIEPGVTPLRPLTAGETSLVRHVFGNMIDPTQVIIVTGVWPSGGAVTPGNIIFFPAPRVPDYSNEPIRMRSWFIHEMTHVMQAQHGQDNIATAANLWIGNHLNYANAYLFDRADLGQPFNFFNME